MSCPEHYNKMNFNNNQPLLSQHILNIFLFYQKWTFLVVHRTTFHKKQAFQIGHHFFGCLFSCCKDKSRAILTALFDFVSWQKLNAPSKIFYYLFGPSKLLRSQTVQWRSLSESMVHPEFVFGIHSF